MIYTSYFGNLKKFPNNLEPICIARWKPRWYTGKYFAPLAPTDALLEWWRASKQDNDAKVFYTKWYNEQVLSHWSAKNVAERLHSIAGDKTPVLLCFEKSGFCHRHLVRKWFQKNGIKCEEWKG